MKGDSLIPLKPGRRLRYQQLSVKRVNRRIKRLLLMEEEARKVAKDQETTKAAGRYPAKPVRRRKR